MNISQPTLSQQIKALESRYNTSLFQGRRPPLQLSPTGCELLALARQMFAISDTIEELLGDRTVDEAPRIRIAADSPIYAARLASALLEKTPQMAVEVQIDNARDTLARLTDARADVAIVSDPPIDPRFAYQPLYADFLKVVVPAGHALAGAPIYPLAALADECLLQREPSSKTRGACDSLLRAHDIAPARTLEMHSREAIREAVALGVGISVFFSSDCPPDSRLAVLEPERQPDSALLIGYVVCRVERRRSSVLRLALAAAATLAPLSPIPLELMTAARTVALAVA